MHIKSALTFFPKDLYNSTVELNKALKIKNQTSHFIMVMLNFILLPAIFDLGFYHSPVHLTNVLQQLVKEYLDQQQTVKRKDTDIFCYCFVRYGIT